LIQVKRTFRFRDVIQMCIMAYAREKEGGC